jgi:hypothetical protein
MATRLSESKGQSMTEEQFVELLHDANETWMVFGEAIRTFSSHMCPVTFVAYKATGKEYPKEKYQEAAEECGIPLDFARAVAEASDNYHDPANDHASYFLRNRILQAVSSKKTDE